MQVRTADGTVLVISESVTRGEALAACCRRRGFQVVDVRDPSSPRAAADVVVIEVSATDALVTLASDGQPCGRVIGIGRPTGTTADDRVDVWVGPDAGIPDLMAAIERLLRSQPTASNGHGSMRALSTVPLAPGRP